jgi:hypothetical protein
VVDHARATKYRLLEIARAARLLNEAGQQRLKKSYGRLPGPTRAVTLRARAVLARLSSAQLSAQPDATNNDPITAVASIRMVPRGINPFIRWPSIASTALIDGIGASTSTL